MFRELTFNKRMDIENTSVLLGAVDICLRYASFSTNVPHPGPRGGSLLMLERKRAFCLKFASSATIRLYSHLNYLRVIILG
jgi:hypothetical protein